jgi:hypothetical protein
MSLPLLVGGSAECGPSANNPLRGLTKNFDKDRGVQQVRTVSPLDPTLPLNVSFHSGSFGPEPRWVLQPSKMSLVLRVSRPSDHKSLC